MPGTVQKIFRWPSDRLRAVSKPLPPECINDAIRLIAADLEATVASKKEGVGLSAIQIGMDVQLFVLEKRVVVEGATEGYVAFVNPKLVEHSAETETANEGCLSLPGIYLPVQRFTQVTVQALDLEGKEFTVVAKGFSARAIQHEMDHLVGKTIADYVGGARRDMIRSKLPRKRN